MQFTPALGLVGITIVCKQHTWKGKNMAQIKITDATVAFLNSKGFTAKAQVMVMGEMRDEYYKIWTDEKFGEGDIVEIVGDLSSRVEEFTSKRTGNLERTAAIHVNNPMIKAGSDAPF